MSNTISNRCQSKKQTFHFHQFRRLIASQTQQEQLVNKRLVSAAQKRDHVLYLKIFKKLLICNLVSIQHIQF